jgi:hypothetical protein
MPCGAPGHSVKMSEIKAALDPTKRLKTSLK